MWFGDANIGLVDGLEGLNDFADSGEVKDWPWICE